MELIELKLRVEYLTKIFNPVISQEITFTWRQKDRKSQILKGENET